MQHGHVPAVGVLLVLLALAERHLFRAARVNGVTVLDDATPGLDVLVVEVQARQLAACLGEGAEVLGQGYARQLLLEVGRKALPILRRVQDAIDVEEDVLLGEILPAVLLIAARKGARIGLAEDVQRPVGNGIVPCEGLLRMGGAAAKERQLPAANGTVIVVEEDGTRS